MIWAALGVTISRGEDHASLFEHLRVERPDTADLVAYDRADLFPDVLPCLERCRAAGLLVGVAGNQSAATEEWIRRERLPVDVIGTSDGWGVAKPSPAFFERIVAEAGCEPHEVAYVGDRVDNDVLPALAAGLVAVHLRRGPWGYLQRGAERAHLWLDLAGPASRTLCFGRCLDGAARHGLGRIGTQPTRSGHPSVTRARLRWMTPGWVGGGGWVPHHPLAPVRIEAWASFASGSGSTRTRSPMECHSCSGA